MNLRGTGRMVIRVVPEPAIRVGDFVRHKSVGIPHEGDPENNIDSWSSGGSDVRSRGWGGISPRESSVIVMSRGVVHGT